VKFGIVVFPGSNCDHDCHYALKNVLGQDVVYLWHKSLDLESCDCIILPGGFSYGDYLRAGAIAAKSNIMSSVKKFANSGGLVMGICNGFQILQECGLLPGTLIKNDNLKFVCKNIHLRIENSSSPFSSSCKEKEILRMPIAHACGSFYINHRDVKDLEDNGQVLLRYSSESGNVTNSTNPNGSVSSIAGVVNKEGNICGMMPHPERCCEKSFCGEDGRKIFDSIIKGSR